MFTRMPKIHHVALAFAVAVSCYLLLLAFVAAGQAPELPQASLIAQANVLMGWLVSVVFVVLSLFAYVHVMQQKFLNTLP